MFKQAAQNRIYSGFQDFLLISQLVEEKDLQIYLQMSYQLVFHRWNLLRREITLAERSESSILQLMQASSLMVLKMIFSWN